MDGRVMGLMDGVRLKEAKRIRLQPGEKIIISAEDDITQDFAFQVTEAVAAFFEIEKDRVMVITGCDIDVAVPAAPAAEVE
jgi:hypothetical protein